MEITVIGVQRSVFTGRDGQLVEGINIYGTYPLQRGDGLGCDKVYIYQGTPPNIGDKILLIYNKVGKCRGWIIAG